MQPMFPATGSTKIAATGVAWRWRSTASRSLYGAVRVAGAMMREGPPKGRDFGLGPLSEALSHEDRKALRRAFLERHPDIRGERREMQAEFDALAAALRAEPFDPAAVDSALAAIAARNQSLLDTGRALVAERLKAMTAEDRAAFAERLEDRSRRKGKSDG